VDKGRAFILSKHFQAAAQLTTGMRLSATDGNDKDDVGSKLCAAQAGVGCWGYFCLVVVVGHVAQGFVGSVLGPSQGR
jgi:hypothetical protein